MKIIIVGLGSIGNKHLETLMVLKRKHPLDIIRFSPSSHREPEYFKELATQIKDNQIEAAIICNPTFLHLQTVRLCLELGLHVFVEKPISDVYDPQEIRVLVRLARKQNLTVMVGYDMRFNPWIKKVKELIEDNQIGDVWGLRIVAGQYLPNWRKIDYRKVYSAKKELGGGVLLDLSHEIDYLTWLLDKKIKTVSARQIYTKRIQIETEDVCSMIFEYVDKSVAEVHLDYLNIPYRRSMEVYGEKGTIVWDGNLNTVLIYTNDANKPLAVKVNWVKQNDTYYDELDHFIECTKSGSEPINSLANSLYVSKIIDRVGKSSRLGRAVKF